jgi:hypothetical protein
MGVSDKVTLSGPGAYIASLEREIAALRASTDALAEALQMLLDAVNGRRVTVGDCNEARAALAAAQSNKGEAS